MEDEEWNWNDTRRMDSSPTNLKLTLPVSYTTKPSIRVWQDELVDDVPVRGTRLLSDVYQRCHTSVCKRADYEKAKTYPNWVATMKEELLMIEMNKTYELVD